MRAIVIKGGSELMNTTITTQDTETRQTILLSKKGMKELRKSVAQLEHGRLAAIRGLRECDKTTGHDDRFERIERLARLEAIEAELHEKQRALSQAKLIPSRRARIKVAVGSVVDLIDQQGRLFRYTLVESIEANPSDGRISAKSPLGSSLVGKTVKDVIEWGNGTAHGTMKLVRIT
jgi:transcription elongation factor GreA